MNDYKIPIIEPTIDYTKVPPINQKRTISFINHFIAHTVTFLNKFALSCEERLFEFENKLQRIEASLEILESWLSSVPSPERNQEAAKTPIEINDNAQEEKSTPTLDEPDTTTEDEPKNTETKEQPVNKDPRYEKYFKMVHVGVPKGAVKIKMEQEGLDSSLLEEPDTTTDEPKNTETKEQPVNKDPWYEKYFKMMHVGVPKEAVKIKMEQEGLDSSILDHPQQIVSKPKSTNNGEKGD